MPSGPRRRARGLAEGSHQQLSAESERCELHAAGLTLPTWRSGAGPPPVPAAPVSSRTNRHGRPQTRHRAQPHVPKVCSGRARLALQPAGDGANFGSFNYYPGVPRRTGQRRAERGHCPLKRPQRIPGNRTWPVPTPCPPRRGATAGGKRLGPRPQDQRAREIHRSGATISTMIHAPS